MFLWDIRNSTQNILSILKDVILFNVETEELVKVFEPPP